MMYVCMYMFSLGITYLGNREEITNPGYKLKSTPWVTGRVVNRLMMILLRLQTCRAGNGYHGNMCSTCCVAK